MSHFVGLRHGTNVNAFVQRETWVVDVVVKAVQEGDASKTTEFVGRLGADVPNAVSRVRATDFGQIL